MALQKQNTNINFAQGLQTKADPWQIAPGQFLQLVNSVFDKQGLLKKRNGYAQLASLTDTSNYFCTTFNDNLTAIGTSLNTYTDGTSTWANKGDIHPLALETLSLIRNNNSQTQCDAAVSSNNLVCVVYTDVGSSTTYKYAVIDLVTGQNVISAQSIPSGSGTISGSPRVFTLADKFIIVFSNTILATPHLQYVAISTINPTIATSVTDITAQYAPASTVAWDGVVANNILYLAWNGSDGGGAIRISSINSALTQTATVAIATYTATMISLCADTSQSSPVIYISTFDGTNGYTMAVNQITSTVFSFQSMVTTGTVLNVASAAVNGVCTVYYETDNNYTYDAAIDTNYIRKNTITQAGVAGTISTLVRSVGLGSKAVVLDDVIYFLGVYSSSNQPTYFLLNEDAQVVSRLAYQNARGYYTTGLPSLTLIDNVAYVSYLFKTLIEPVNKTQGATISSGVYAQTGINLAKYTIGSTSVSTAEIGSNLHLSGGFLWAYDGVAPVEQNFFLYPDNVEVTTSGLGGSIAAGSYYYVALYEWTDNQGNIHRSAPSIPVQITTVGATSTNTVYVPTLRLTYKTTNPIKIMIYRWSTANQTYYQVTSISSPTFNSTSADYITFTDTQADSSIIGNSILYTTGGVVENIGAPAPKIMTLFKSRLIMVNSENPNELWYSKQVQQGTPVEMSDLFTLFVAPTTGAQGATGPITALSAMDDKIIVFKKNAIYYITGNGPDATGANNDFSEPVFITSTAGCDNQLSVVLMPQGVMFESDKGIWLLGRDLSTQYVGAPVESYNGDAVQSAVNVPGTNQVRFTLESGVTLMYDYFYNQWGTFTNVSAISSTLYQNLHTYINSRGEVYQESIGSYLDGSRPVLMNFTTGWFNMAGLQGFQRAYFFYLLGRYYSPHFLQVQVSFDYNEGPTQTTILTPSFNDNNFYGDDPLYGSGQPLGGPGFVEQFRVFLQQQKCQSFQIKVQESFDSGAGEDPGAGLTLSGINLVYGIKKPYFTTPGAQNAG